MLGGLVVVLGVALGVLWTVQAGVALPNTVVAGIDVSGLGAGDVRAELSALQDERLERRLVFTFEGEEHALVAADVGYQVDLQATVDAVLRRGRTGLPGDIRTRLAAYSRSEEIELLRALDEEAVTGWVDDLADELDREEVTGDVEVDPSTLEVEATLSQGEVVVNRDAVAETIREAFLRGGPSEVDLPAATTPQPLDNAVIRELAATFREALAGPLRLSANGESLTLAPPDIAELIDAEHTQTDAGESRLALAVTAERVDEVFGEVARGRFESDPVNADYTASRTPPARFDTQGSTTYRPVAASVSIIEGRDGRRFDPERTAEQLAELFSNGAREAELDLEILSAEFSNADAREQRPSHAIGTFTTYYTAGQIRATNIQLLADVIDGTLVRQGGQFSINEVSGARTCDKGYAPAGTIVAGELTDTCGGGTSQFGTTTFNAAFFAGVQLDQWKAHSWYISRYPMGREATLSYPYLDVKFTNNTDGAVLVKTSHTATSVTVTLYGQPRAEAVSATHGSPRNRRDFEEETRTTDELERGQERVLQSGASGFQVTVTRTVDLVGGGEETRTINTTYTPQRRIVERGTAEPDEPDAGSTGQDE